MNINDKTIKNQLNDKTSGKCFPGKKEPPHFSDNPPTPPTLIGKPSKTWNTGENPPIDETPVKPFPILNVVAVIVSIAIVITIMSPTYLSNLNYALTGESSEARAEIFADANAWGQSCSNAITSYNEDRSIDNKLLAQVSCQGYLDYLQINREVLDSGTVKNLASDNILSLEEEIKRLDASTPASGGTGTATPILPITTGSITGTWVGNYEMQYKTGDPKKYTGTIKLILKQNGNGISGSQGNKDVFYSITGTINSNNINFDDGFMFFSGNLVATNVLNLNAETCLDSKDGYCVDSRLVGTTVDGEIPAGYVSSPGAKFIMTLTRQ